MEYYFFVLFLYFDWLIGFISCFKWDVGILINVFNKWHSAFKTWIKHQKTFVHLSHFPIPYKSCHLSESSVLVGPEQQGFILSFFTLSGNLISRKTLYILQYKQFCTRKKTGTGWNSNTHHCNLSLWWGNHGNSTSHGARADNKSGFSDGLAGVRMNDTKRQQRFDTDWFVSFFCKEVWFS